MSISIHALREEGDVTRSSSSSSIGISIHALREEGDQTTKKRRSTSDTFLSTPSARRATSLSEARDQVRLISIHALREEGDRAVRLS